MLSFLIVEGGLKSWCWSTFWLLEGSKVRLRLLWLWRCGGSRNQDFMILISNSLFVLNYMVALLQLLQLHLFFFLTRFRWDLIFRVLLHRIILALLVLWIPYLVQIVWCLNLLRWWQRSLQDAFYFKSPRVMNLFMEEDNFPLLRLLVITFWVNLSSRSVVEQRPLLLATSGNCANHHSTIIFTLVILI